MNDGSLSTFVGYHVSVNFGVKRLQYGDHKKGVVKESDAGFVKSILGSTLFWVELFFPKLIDATYQNFSSAHQVSLTYFPNTQSVWKKSPSVFSSGFNDHNCKAKSTYWSNVIGTETMCNIVQWGLTFSAN